MENEILRVLILAILTAISIDERFQAVLRDPSIVDRQVELALRGEDLDDDGRPDGCRGGREREREPVGAGS